MSYQHRYELETVRENEEYVLTAVVDERFMSEAVFPVVVDPTVIYTEKVFVNGEGAKIIQDAPIYEDRPNYAHGSNNYLHIGESPSAGYGVGRALMRFPNLRYVKMHLKNTATGGTHITSLNLNLYADSGPTSDIYVYYSNAVGWTESGAMYGNTNGGSPGSEITHQSVSGTGYKAFNLSNAIQNWIVGDPYDGVLDRGILIRNGTESNSAKIFLSTEWSDTSKRPYITVGYNANYGAAPLYAQVAMDEIYVHPLCDSVNCAGHALQILTDVNETVLGLVANDGVEQVATKTMNYFRRTQPGRTIRELNGLSDTLNSNEYRVALRCTTNNTNNFHFIMQTADGDWASKGSASSMSTNLGYFSINAGVWSIPSAIEEKTYESKTILFAVSRPTKWFNEQ
jgi:hypothetical protein